MKKTASVLLLLAVAAVGLFAYSPKMKISGLVHIYGSEPHTFVGFVTDEGKSYTLLVDDKSEVTLQQLSDLQGYKLELTGRIIKEKKNHIGGFEELKDGKFIVQTAVKKGDNN